MGFLDFLFGKSKNQIDSEYSTAIKDTEKQMAEASYQDAQNRAFYDANKELFDKQGVKDYNEAFGNYADTSKSYQNQLATLENERAKAQRQNKYNVAGNGLIGAIINPIAQTADIAGDMFSTGAKSAGNLISGLTTGDWTKYGTAKELNRYARDDSNDFLSDIGAIGETALNVAQVGALGDAAKGGLKLGSNIGKTAAVNAGLGAAENTMSALRESGRDVTGGDLALNAGIGALMGGGMGAIAQLGGNAANIARANRASGAVTTPLARTGLGRVGQGINDTLNLGRFMPKNNTAVKVGAGVGGGLLLSKLLGGNKNQNPNTAGMTDEEIYNYIYGGGQ